MIVEIEGLGTARPTGRLTQEDALALNVTRAGLEQREARLMRRLYRMSTVQERASVLVGSADQERPLEEISGYYPPASSEAENGPSISRRMARYEQEAPALASAAASIALRAAKIDPGQIDQLVTVSCTGFFAPGLDSALIRRLELRPDTGRSMIGFMGCHGAVNGLRVASALAKSEPGCRVLLAAVELCTLHFHYGSEEGRAVANTLFADGAAAAILRATDGASAAEWSVGGTGTCLLPESTDDMSWRIGDHGFEMTLSSRVPSIIGSQLRAWLETWLGTHDLAVEDVGSWAIHPGGPRVIDAVEHTLGLTPQDTATSRAILAEHGNMSSPTVLFILERMSQQHAARPCVMLAFGPGLVVEAALLV